MKRDKTKLDLLLCDCLMLPLKLGRTCKSLILFGARLRETHVTSFIEPQLCM